MTRLRLKPHMLVIHKPAGSYYETREPWGTEAWWLEFVDPATGGVEEYLLPLQILATVKLELVAPTHPVYLKWAARRLADRLEGLDRT